jgi:hypothetical protein
MCLDAAGFHFIVSTTDSPVDKEDRRAIRSHTTKAQGKRRKNVKLQSWISPSSSLGTVKQLTSQKLSNLSGPIPDRVGGDFSALQLPLGIEPVMIQDLVQRT